MQLTVAGWGYVAFVVAAGLYLTADKKEGPTCALPEYAPVFRCKWPGHGFTSFGVGQGYDCVRQWDRLGIQSHSLAFGADECLLVIYADEQIRLPLLKEQAK
jgi:hypothetical protein